MKITEVQAAKEIKKLQPEVDRIMAIPNEEMSSIDAMILVKALRLYKILDGVVEDDILHDVD